MYTCQTQAVVPGQEHTAVSHTAPHSALLCAAALYWLSNREQYELTISAKQKGSSSVF